ncbi:amidase family protein [Daldinia caldariorum]|uniref:amidase family protein n=1 Tax=Daldinia caldariorum TaxID=326644 RepID=UPI002007E302|nr:amidase family protein [Daldinia caldariorum]KAI1471951.1 amidase family protein [Daldinia caldariorum]
MAFSDSNPRGSIWLLLCACLIVPIKVLELALASPMKRAPLEHLQTTRHGDVAFGLGDRTYLANIRHPKQTILLGGDGRATASRQGSLVPFTAVFTDREVVTADSLRAVIESYLSAGDDVFSEDFLEGIYIGKNGTSDGSSYTRTTTATTLDASALEYLNNLAPQHLILDAGFESIGCYPTDIVVTYLGDSDTTSRLTLPAGPYAALVSEDSITLGAVYRLHRDSHRDFLYGAYDSGDGHGTFAPVELFQPRSWEPLIPVPSRIHSWGDPRPLAGLRVAIKDLFDVKGLATSGGSRAWASIAGGAANETAPCVRRIVDDLGAVLVGKYKLAQFASGADPWGWQDAHYPFNPRGDGWLTCSASSSGGGCAVAAYAWLDFAIGSDTGSSMRRPAAVSGTYGNRPSQGLMTLSGVMPLGAATDTAGIFARSVRDWVRFAKSWYVPEMYQDASITGLSPLDAPDSYAFPKRVLYLTDYLPLRNPAAEEVLQGFIRNLTAVFGMTVEEFNLTAVVANTTDEVPKYAALNNATAVINTMTQYRQVGKPLISAWAERYEGRFPPIDPAQRQRWKAYDESVYTDELYNRSLRVKRAAVDWFESTILYSTPESCSESIMLWDIGTGGLPSYREESLNRDPNTTTFLAVTPSTAGINGASLCPIYGCVDMTIPIGQVPYLSNVTFVEEMIPVTVSVVARRGCDFMLWNMWQKLADEGVLKTIKTGRTAF